MNTLSIVFFSVVVIYLATEIWLGLRQIQHVNKYKDSVPDDFVEKISLDEHQKSAEYTVAKQKLSLITAPFSAIILLMLTLGGGFNFLDTLLRTLEWSPLWTGVSFLLTISVLSTLLDLPIAWYSTFKLEEKYGFNRTTVAVFFTDLVKNILVGIIFGLPLFFVILWLVANSGKFWWLWVWLTWLGFTGVMIMIYPTIIAPLFNKFKKLENEELNKIINNLLTRSGFNSNGIFVMDGSKRSGHGNAYFTGFGNNKRIVFFDTLLESLSNTQVESVLAHELGHFKHNHVKKNMVLMAIISLFSLWLLGTLIDKDWFYYGLGISQPSDYTALILFFSALPVFSFFITPIFSWFSRKHEYEADKFATQQADGKELISALVVMYKENAKTLTPDPIHSLVYDSHPPAPLRINYIKSQLNTKES